MLGTKEDFELIRQQINIETVVDYLMQKQGRMYIYPGEKTASIRIYPETQSFYDYGRARGGDVVRLWSHVQKVDSWTALQQIRETFGLNMPDRKNSRDLIWQQEQAHRNSSKSKRTQNVAGGYRLKLCKENVSFIRKFLNQVTLSRFHGRGVFVKIG